MNVEIIDTGSGYVTGKVYYFDTLLQREAKLYLCSRINPIKEAQEWADKVYQERIKQFIVYGLGLGYHIEALSQRLKGNQEIQVIECHTELARQLTKYIDRNIQKKAEVKLLITDDIKEIIQVFNSLDAENSCFSVYAPSLQIIPAHLQPIQEVIQNFQLKKIINGRFSEDIRENYNNNNNKDYNNVEELYNCWDNKPVIIVSGGPSLDKNVHLLKDVSKDVKIFSTGRTLKMLIEQNIKVDMFCIIDSQKWCTSIQIEGMEDLDIPFVLLNTVSHHTAEQYLGPKYIAYSMDSPQEQKGRIESGGSVATTMLELAIKFGGNPIIFIGQDLAYTNGLTHSTAARADEVNELPNMKKVRSIDGTYIPTTAGLLSFKYWIERKIIKHPNIKFYNCTEGGAYIEGCKHQTLLQTLEELKANG